MKQTRVKKGVGFVTAVFLLITTLAPMAFHPMDTSHNGTIDLMDAMVTASTSPEGINSHFTAKKISQILDVLVGNTRVVPEKSLKLKGALFFAWGPLSPMGLCFFAMGWRLQLPHAESFFSHPLTIDSPPPQMATRVFRNG